MNSEPMIQVPIPQHVQRAESSLAPPDPLPPPKVTHMTEFFIQGVESEVRRLMPVSLGLRAYLVQLAGTLHLNELELVAWAYVLKRVLYGEPLDSQTPLLQFSAYLAKTLMCRDLAGIDAELARNCPAFKASYEQWLASHRRCADLSIRDLHFQFKDMWTRGRTCSNTVNLNSVVDSLVQATTKATETPCALLSDSSFEPGERQPSGSSASTEAPQTHSGFLDQLSAFSLRI